MIADQRTLTVPKESHTKSRGDPNLGFQRPHQENFPDATLRGTTSDREQSVFSCAIGSSYSALIECDAEGAEEKRLKCWINRGSNTWRRHRGCIVGPRPESNLSGCLDCHFYLFSEELVMKGLHRLINYKYGSYMEICTQSIAEVSSEPFF